MRVYYSTGLVQFIEDDISGMGGEVLGYFHDPLNGGRGIAGTSVALLPGEDAVQVKIILHLKTN